MWYQILIPAPVLMIPVLVMTTKGIHQASKNKSDAPSDVIVTYSNHAEAGQDDRVMVITEKNTVRTGIPATSTERSTMKMKEVKESREREESLQEDVLFVPNEKEVVRNEDYLQHDGINIQDLMGGHKTVQELLSAKDVRVETESQHPDIMFITGKNNENIDQSQKNKPKQKRPYENYPFKIVERSTPTPKLKCTNLVCNNTIESICGEKVENHQLKYRLFLNDCYFRKVNCNFKSSVNRYKQVELNLCKNHMAHQTPFSFKPSIKFEVKPVQVNNSRRNFSSRRSMTMSIDGQFCSHACPVFCPEHYEPECAVSSTGRHRVFVNHCALDHNSCSFGIVWRSVPLAECVGGKKADLKQNAGFIGWMQRVGIVDKKGRLTLNP